LVSLNDVGFDPRAFGVSLGAFHQENHQRLDKWPQTMVTTSSHDSKRGEDVRARINVLSEVPDEWRQHLARWSRINGRKKRLLDNTPAPCRNDEYLLYQTLLGAWPLQPLDATGLAGFRARIQAYMLKAIKEAKVYTSWVNPNGEYEDAMQRFVHAVLDRPERNAFLADFIPFQKRVAHCGLLNSLSQALLKLTVPGVPDIYQGNELWSLNLVDPDNRRSVDYHHREAQLKALLPTCQPGRNLPEVLQDLLNGMEDGRAKLYVTWRTLALRRQRPTVFSEGEYLDLKTHGPRADHICAFARRFESHEIIVAATRWFARLMGDFSDLPLGSPTWDDTCIELSQDARAGDYRDVLSDQTVPTGEHDDGLCLRAADLFRYLPLCLLTND
jgi:(1->4)-alpha-D-glucan 1-alpha-D-glucosylmutase